MRFHRTSKEQSSRADAALVVNLILWVTIALALTGVATAGAQEIAWLEQFGTPETDAIVGLSADKTGVYAVGYTYGTFPGQVVTEMSEAFVRKYDHEGNEIWTDQFGAPGGWTSGSGIFVHKTGLYVSGGTQGAFDGFVNAGSTDGFVRKYDVDGNEIWTHQFGSASYDVETKTAVGNDGVYLVGGTAGTLPGQTSAGGEDAFVRKLTLSGGEVWTRQFGTPGWDRALGLAVLHDEVYIAGTTASAFPTPAVAGDDNYVFLRRLDIDGNVVWIRQLGTSDLDMALYLSGDETGVYVGGSTSGVLPGQINAGGDDACVRKYSRHGHEIWTHQFGTSTDDATYRLAAVPSGVIVCGYTSGALPGQMSLGGWDAFVRMYDLRGQERWTLQMGTAELDITTGIAFDRMDIYIAASTAGAFPGQTNAGGLDPLVAKIVKIHGPSQQ